MTMSWKVCCLGIALLSLVSQNGSRAATLTITNSCEYTIWPVIGQGAGARWQGPTGFELRGGGEKRTIQAPKGWVGSVWGRTLCSFDTAGKGKCATGDCGTGLEYNDTDVMTLPAVTLAEFGLNSFSNTDFYDVSLVDGFNVPMVVQAAGGNGSCRTTGCLQDLNRICPKDLQVAGNVACKSGCTAFGKPEYCCTGAAGKCKPSKYSLFYKAACPRTYTYALDDTLDTFNCSNADYFVTFCPSPASHRTFTRPTTSGVALPPPPPPPSPSTHRNSTPSVHLAPSTSTPSSMSPLPLPSLLAFFLVHVSVLWLSLT